MIVRPMAGCGGLEPDSTVDNLNIAPRNHGYLRTRHRLHNPSFGRDACRQARPCSNVIRHRAAAVSALELVALLAAV